MQQTISEASVERKVSAPLAIGIFLLPGLFVWFLLRRGHGATARLIGFGWVGFLLLISTSIMGISPKPHQAPSVVAANETQEPTATEAAPPDEKDTQYIAARPELSDAAKRMKLLYDELNGFRRDPEFQRVGFGLCCRYNRWKLSVEELLRSSGHDLSKELRIPPGEMLQLGLHYAMNEGRQTQLSKSFSARIEFALTPTFPKPGGGRAMKEGWWCKDIETWLASMRASDAGEYAKASNMVYEPACPHVLPNATTGPELERRYYTFPDGVTRAGFAKVRLKDGVEVWAPLDAIEFRQ